MKNLLAKLGLTHAEEAVLEQYEINEEHSEKWKKRLEKMSVSDLHSTLTVLQNHIQDYLKMRDDGYIPKTRQDFFHVEYQENTYKAVIVKGVLHEKVEDIFKI